MGRVAQGKVKIPPESVVFEVAEGCPDGKV